MPDKPRHPFNQSELDPDHEATYGADYASMAESIQRDVVGQRVVQVTHTKELDREASRKAGFPLEALTSTIELENGISYITKVLVPYGAVFSSGQGLAR